jgi:hypothetical protein
MKLGKPQGMAIMTLGLLLLTGGILVLVYVPSWGHWIGTYPERLAQAQVPPEATGVVKGIKGGLGPLITQIGDNYVRTAGYFIGSLLTIVSFVAISVGTMVLKNAKNPTSLDTK